jgi:hypothetical protein
VIAGAAGENTVLAGPAPASRWRWMDGVLQIFLVLDDTVRGQFSHLG